MKLKKSAIVMLIAIFSLATVLMASCGTVEQIMPPDHSITIEAPDPIAHNKTVALVPAIDGLEDVEFNFSSDNEDVATVDEDGVVKGLAVGTANITITATVLGVRTEELSATVKVTVTHSYGEYEYVTVPDFEHDGVASRVCEYDGDIEYATVPDLNDESWTVSAEKSIAPTYLDNGTDVYVHDEFPDVETSTDTVAMPAYVGQHYTITTLYESGNMDLYRMNDFIVSEMAANFDCTAEMIADDSRVVDCFGSGAAFHDHSAEDGSFTISYVGKDYTAYIDAATGIIVEVESKNHYVNIAFPTTRDNGASTDYLSSKRREGDYAFGVFNGGKDYFVEFKFDNDGVISIYANEELVVFGAELKADGEDIHVADLADNNFVDVLFDGKYLANYGRKDGNLISLDGLEGEYASHLEVIDEQYDAYTVALDGIGGICIFDDGELKYKGTYELTENADYIADVYLANGTTYLRLVSFDNGTVNLVYPYASLILELNGGEVVGSSTFNVNINVPAEIETPTKEGYEFVGWYADENFETLIGNKITVEEAGANVHVYAKYLPKVTLTVYFAVDEGNEEPRVYEHGQIAVIETYDLYNELVRVTGYKENYYDSELYYAFDAFAYGDSDKIAEGDFAVTSDMEAITVAWTFAPPYVGSFYGTEVWSASSGNSGKSTLTIAKSGSISGLVTGYVYRYDAASQKIYWTKNKDDETPKGYFFFDADSGIIAGVYSSMDKDIGYDAYVLSRNNTDTNYKFAAAYGVYGPAVGDMSANYLAHFFTVPTPDGGTEEVLVYVNHIYSGITIKDTAGNEYNTSTIKNAKTLLVYDKDGNIVYTAATSANTFNAGNGSSYYLILDLYFGTYTSDGGKDIILDGVGGISYDGKNGTYALSDGEDDTFDVYLNNRTEYYQLTIGDNHTYTAMEKVMVNLAFDTNAAVTNVNVEAVSANKNISIDLPSVEDTSDYVFRGWYADAEFETKLENAYVPTENATIYGKFLERVDITVNYNGGADVSGNITVYGKGETTVIGNPKLAGQKFAGWFTSETFDEGTEWVSGEAIYADVEIFAKWVEAPAYYHTYGNVQVYETTGLGGVSSKYSYSSDGAILDVSAEGTATATAYPFRGDVTVYYTDEDAGQLIIKVGSSSYYKGYIDKPTGLIVMAYSSSTSESDALAAQIGQVTLLSPFETGSLTSHISSSYWNGGNTRAIEYTYNDHVYGILVHEGAVYFNVAFVDENGDAIPAIDCYDGDKAPYINVVDAGGESIVELYHLRFEVTINYGDNSGLESKTFNAQDGEVLQESVYKPSGLNTEGKAFAYWYLDDSSVEYDFSTPITGALTINAAWKDAAAQFGDWKGWNFYGSNAGTASLSDSYAFSVNADGVIYQGIGSKFKDYHIINTELLDGPVNIASGSTTYYMYYNQEAGVLWSQYSGNSTGVGTDTALFFLQSNFKSATYAGKIWNSHYFGFVNIVYKDDSSKTIMCYNDRIYVVTLPEGTSLTDARDKELTLYNADGTKVFAVKNGSTILFNDGLGGTYTSGDDQLVVDGFGIMTLNDDDFNYNKCGDNVISYVVEGIYHEIVLNGDTFEDEVANCTVSFNLGDVEGSVDPIIANKTSSIVLPGADGGDLIFSGWYEDEDLTIFAGADGASYTVNSDIVLYAKWSTEAYAIATSSRYPWTYNEENAEWTCGNHNVHSSESTITITAYTAITITFDYACDSENAEKWDYFSITLNNSELLKAGGKVGALNYKDYSVTLAAGDKLVLKYQKDSSTNSDLDIAKIKNFKINGQLIVEI